MNARLTFLSHFVICLACAGLAFFAWTRGVPQTVYANDASMMTSVIAALFVAAAAYLGRQAWRTDDAPRYFAPGMLAAHQPQKPSLDFGKLAEKLSVRMGIAGTVIGLAMQGKSLMGGAAAFGALATSLFTTAVGVGAASILAIMLFNLNQGIKRAGR